MKCLDLCCCSGGASDGYNDAGFEVTGVDIKEQKQYPYSFFKNDALKVIRGETSIQLNAFDFIHASPPCQTHTSLVSIRNAQGRKSAVVDILDEVVDGLVACGKPFIVENVSGATLKKHTAGLHEITLCGSMFGLKVRRHRKFWSNVPITTKGMKCEHKKQGKPIGVYGSKGDHVKGMWKGKMCYGGVTAKTDEEALNAMGFKRKVPWNKLKEAIPPVYSEFLGKQIIDFIANRNK